MCLDWDDSEEGRTKKHSCPEFSLLSEGPWTAAQETSGGKKKQTSPEFVVQGKMLQLEEKFNQACSHRGCGEAPL